MDKEKKKLNVIKAFAETIELLIACDDAEVVRVVVEYKEKCRDITSSLIWHKE